MAEAKDKNTEPKAPKPRLSAEERKNAVQSARKGRLDTFFAKGRRFTYVGNYDAGESKDSRYTDPSGNKGRRGHLIKDVQTGEEIPVGPGTLKKGVEEYKAITGYPPPKAEKATAAPATAPVPATAGAPA